MRPWCLLAGLLAGLCIGFYELACVFGATAASDCPENASECCLFDFVFSRAHFGHARPSGSRKGHAPSGRRVMLTVV